MTMPDETVAEGAGALVRAVSGDPTLPYPERVYFEVNLLKLGGFLFCLDKAEATRRKGGVFDFSKLISEPVTITPNPLFGFPGSLACKVTDAIFKKLSDYGQPVPLLVSFSKRELVALVGRSSYGGRDSVELTRALSQLQATLIAAKFFDKKNGRWGLISFNVLSEVWLSGRGASIEACTVSLNPLIIESLRAKHYACFNYNRMQSLDIVGRQLFKPVFYHFSNLYNGRNDVEYTKDYGDICREWLGGLKELRYVSKIEQEQLGPHLKDLQACGLIRSYKIERNARKDGFNIAFKPGRGFFEDYTRFYAGADQRSFQFVLAEDQSRIQLPLELVAHFYKRLYGVETLSPTTFSGKEMSLAKGLLDEIGFEEAKDLAEYAIEQAPKTKFDIKTFGAVRQYIDAWRMTKERRAKIAAAKASQEAKNREEGLKDRYEEFRHSTVAKLRASLPQETLAALDAEATRLTTEASGGARLQLGTTMLVRIKTDHLIAERYEVPSFDEWKKQVAFS